MTEGIDGGGGGGGGDGGGGGEGCNRGSHKDSSAAQNQESFDVEPEGQDGEEEFDQGHQWDIVDDSIPERQILTKQVKHLVASAAVVCDDIIHASEKSVSTNNAMAVLDEFSRLKQSERESEGLVENRAESMVLDSLDSLAARCYFATQASDITDFIYMISCIQFRLRVIRCVTLLSFQPD